MPGQSQISLLYATQPPQTCICIALDTAFLEGLQPGTPASTGIYMMDNRRNLGSANEGKNNLHTNCYTGDNIAWQVMPIDPVRGDTVIITGFTISSGNLFAGSTGAPKSTSNHSRWTGRAINAKSNAQYQIHFLITDADGNIYTGRCNGNVASV
jgi:outer membrane protein assembly factor BamB